MRDSRSHRRWPVSMRPLVVILLSVCFGLAGSAVHPRVSTRNRPLRATFARDRGGRDRARQAERRRAVGDVARRRRTRPRPSCSRNSHRRAASTATRRRCSSRWSRASRRARRRSSSRCCIGRSAGLGDAQPILTAVFRQGASSSTDPAALLRAGRAAHALNRPREANDVLSRCRTRRRRSGDRSKPRGAACSSTSTTRPKR